MAEYIEREAAIQIVCENPHNRDYTISEVALNNLVKEMVGDA